MLLAVKQPVHLSLAFTHKIGENVQIVVFPLDVVRKCAKFLSESSKRAKVVTNAIITIRQP